MSIFFFELFMSSKKVGIRRKKGNQKEKLFYFPFDSIEEITTFFCVNGIINEEFSVILEREKKNSLLRFCFPLLRNEYESDLTTR